MTFYDSPYGMETCATCDAPTTTVIPTIEPAGVCRLPYCDACADDLVAAFPSLAATRAPYEPSRSAR